MINSSSVASPALSGVCGGIITYLGQPWHPFAATAALSGVCGGIITYLGQPWQPFAATAMLHGAIFTATVSLVSNLASHVFSMMGINGKTNAVLSYTAGAVTALMGSIGAAYFEVTTSAVSPAGVLLLTLSAAAVSRVYHYHKNMPAKAKS